MAGLGIAAALPAISRAQQTMPTVGFLSTRSPDEAAIHTNAFRRGLEEMSYVEGRSVRSSTAGQRATMAVCRHWSPS
jgi:putative tryptophan/tyrosine transport system substrate-binding protein